MRRREFISGLGSVAAWPATTYAQQPALPWIAYIGPGAPPDAATRFVGAFRTGLGDSGYFEGQNISVEYHWLEGRFDRIPALVAELVPRRPAVIVTAIATALLALKTATTTIPVVFGAVDNPVRVGLVSSLARPGGNFTGINFFSAESASKRLGLMHDLVPKATHMAVLINPSNLASSEATLRQIQSAAPILGLSIDILKAGNSREIDQAFADLARERIEALFITGDGYFSTRLVQFATLGRSYRIATSFSGREFAEAGGLMSYGTDQTDMVHHLGAYTGRILKGEKPSDLPVVQPTNSSSSSISRPPRRWASQFLPAYSPSPMR